MATKIVMEALSPTMEEGRLVKWVKNEGDAVKSGDVLAEVETDKAVMELVARGDGVLRKRLAAEGTAAPVGTLLGVIAGPDENIDALVSGAAAAPAASAAASPANAGAQATSAPAAPAQGGAKDQSAVVASAGESTHMSSIPSSAATSQGEASTPPQEHDRRGPGRVNTAPVAGSGIAVTNNGRVKSSPLARRMASERGIELGAVQGSGPGGRIIRRDIEQAQVAGAAQGGAHATVTRGGAEYEDVPLTQIRKTIAKRLAESIGPVPTFYLTAEFDMTRVAEMRAAMVEADFKVSVNDIVIKAVATALAQHPEVNAHWIGTAIRQFHRVHIGMAVAIEDGLITPVIFDADAKRLSEISAEAKELAGRARERRLKPEEYTGSTFSISNLGMFGIDQFTAIINPPEAGILAVGGMEEKPVVVDGELQVRKRMRVTMSCDHRVIDGATGAKFLQTLRRMIENPLMLVY